MINTEQTNLTSKPSLFNDMQQFIDTFGKRINDADAASIKEYGNNRWIRRPRILDSLHSISEGDGILKAFSCGGTDDYGKVLGSKFVVKAYSKDHACLKAALLSNNLEWFTTGFYSAELVNLDELIESTKIQIEFQTEKLNKLLKIK